MLRSCEGLLGKDSRTLGKDFRTLGRDPRTFGRDPRTQLMVRDLGLEAALAILLLAVRKGVMGIRLLVVLGVSSRWSLGIVRPCSELLQYS